MPILTTCDCGTKLRAKDEQAGKRIRCPSCKEVLVVPTLEVTPVPTKPTSSSGAARGAIQPRRQLAQPEEEPDRRAISKERSTVKKVVPDVEPVDDEDEDRPRKKRSLTIDVKKNAKANAGGFAPEAAGFRGGIVGGLAMMLIAVVWFIGGLMADIIFFYPPILFVIGVVALIKGIIDGNIAGKKDTSDDDD